MHEIEHSVNLSPSKYRNLMSPKKRRSHVGSVFFYLINIQHAPLHCTTTLSVVNYGSEEGGGLQ